MKSCKEINRGFAVKKTLNLSSLVQFISRKRFENDSRTTRERLGKVRYFAALLTLLFTIGIGNVWGAEEVVYTLAPASGSNNSYTGNCDVTIDGITWNVSGNSQMQPWRIGGKSITNTDRTVYSKTAMSSAITKVELTVGAASSITVNSLKLIVASDASFNTEIDEVSVTFAANSTLTFTPTSPKTEWATAAYYKFVFNVTVSRSSNKFVEFTEAKFYAEAGGGGCSAPAAPTISGTDSYTAGETITLTASCASGTDASTTYTWYKGADWATARAASPVQAASTSGATFTKASCTTDDTGTYWCEASNGSGCEAHNSTGKAITVSAGGGGGGSAKTLPYEYGFENNNLASEGWTTSCEVATNEGELGICNDATKTGTYGFRFSSYSTASSYKQYLFSPELDTESKVNLSFYYRASSSSGTETFKVGYSTTNNSLSSFTFGEEISTNSTSWQEYNNTFPAGTKYIAIYYYSNYKYRLYIDDFVFTEVTPATIKLSEAGAESTVSGTHYSGDSYTLPSSTEATCGTKVLVGWSTVTVAETDTKPTSNFYEKGASVTLSAGENKFYAVFANATEGTNTATFDAATAAGLTESPSKTWTHSASGITLTMEGSYSKRYTDETPNTWTIGYNKSATLSHYAEITSPYTISQIDITFQEDYPVYSVSNGTLSTLSTTSQQVTGSFTTTKLYPYVTSGTGTQARMTTFTVTYSATTYSNYATSCEACTANPTVGNAALSGAFNSSSIGVTCPSIGAGSNCAINDYGFVWKAGSVPTISDNKTQVGTNNQSTAFNGTLSGTFNTSTTYYVKAYATNNGDNTILSSTALEINPRSITFNSNGGSSVAQIFVNSGSVAVQPANPTKDGYGFEGWFTDNGTFASPVNWSATITSNQNYYAKWGALKYDVTYNAGANGTGSVEGQKKTHDVALTLSSSTFTREGYTQDGWSTSDGGDKAYDLGGSYTANAAITLYPHWAINNYSVSWSVNGSSWSSGVTDANNNANYGSTVSAPTAPTSSDCDDEKVFVGWTDAEYSNPSTAPTTLFTSTSPAITTNTTFYAVFAEASSGGGVATVFSEDFSDCTGTGGNSGGWSGSIASTTTPTSISSSWFLSYDKAADGCLKLGNGDYAGSATTPDIDCGAATSATLTFRAGSWSGDGTVLGLTGTNCTLSESSITLSDASFTSYTISITSITDEISITFASATKKQRFFLDDVVVKTSSVSYSDYTTTCCQQPATQLSMTADKTELVGTGLIELSLVGGNGEDITWSCRDEADANCDALLSSTSNSGATFTVSSPAATTKTYTVQALQPEKDLDGEGIVCGKTLKIEITVKTQWTITFKTTDESVLTTYSTTTVTDGDTYTFPDLSDDYTCETNYSFVGWKEINTAGAPEYAAGSSATASADKTWYAVWMHSNGTTTETRDKYVRMTSGQSIAANDVVVVAYVDGGVALKQMTEDDEAGAPIAVDFSADKSYLTFAPGTAVMQLKALWHDDADNDLDGWLLQDNSADFRLTYSGDKGGTLYYTDESGWFWDITITAQNNAIIEDTETGYDYSLKYNTSRNVFAFYSSGQKIVQLYRKNGTISIDVPSAPTYSVNNTHCTNGATIRANGGQWITSAKDQKVRLTVPVTAKNFATSSKQITGSSDNAHFAVSVASHTIPSDKSESAPINVTIEYTPAEANVIETANITLTTGAGADDATRVIEVNGRSLPDEFVIMTQKESKWQALPADMFSGASTYEPTQVYPNGGLTLIPAAPYTAIYSAREVAASRYEAAGGCMRLVGNNNKCLWANGSNGLTTIQNFAQYGSTNGSNYEWLLYTEDGEQYTIANPAHPEYATGRQLGIYALKYGLYKTSDVFYLLPVGCSNMPGNVQITPRRVDATFSWETNASSVTIDIYTNEAMTEGHQTANVSEVPYLFTGLAERTNYWYKLTPDGNTECAVTGSFSTTGPIIDIVEWQENAAVIFVDKDEAVNPRVVIDGEVEHGQGGVMATNIFFSKYFEAEGYAKMLAIFNGTGNAISLADVTIQQRSTGSGYTPFSLASYGKTAGWIQPGEEIILFNSDPRDGIMKCAVSDPTYPTWNNVENKNLEFGGKGTVRLFKGGKCIDIIGAMAADAEDGDIDNYDKAPLDGTNQPSWGDKPGFTVSTGDDYNTHDDIENNYGLSTNRCLLIRQNWVTSGDSAVLNNYGDFKTLGTYTDANSKTHKGEWAGLQVPDASGGEEEYIHTCEGFQEVGQFDYNKYYKEYTKITDDKLLSQFSKDAEGNYIIPFDYMRQYACLNLKFQLTRATDDPYDEEDVLTEQIVQVPIVVKTAKSTNDTLFNHIVKKSQPSGDPLVSESIERCKTCNVVVLGTGTLTKAADDATNDVPQMGNLKIYPGGKLIVPSSTNYTVNSLAFRRQEDEVSMANIQGGLTINHENSVFLDVRIDPSSWHYMALPYNCRVGDITWSDGTPAKVNADYLLAWYDGEKRAADKKGGWTSITDNEFVLKTGIGYIVALPGSGNIKREIRFPMGNDLIEAEDDNKAITELHAWGGNNDELRPNHKGWNMIGNPYLLTYNNTAGSTGTIMTDPLVVGKLVEYPNVANWDGSWVYDPTSVSENLRYIVAPIDNGWSGYAQTTINDMKPFTSYFVQIGGAEPTANRTVTFKAAGVPRSVIRRAPQEYREEDNHPVFYGIELTAPNNEKDRTALLISNDFTDDYDMMDDLAKQRGDYYKYYPYPVLASRNNEGEMAFNALPDTSAATVGVPLNYYAAQAGTHTIATDFRYDLEEVKSVMLYDATNNTYTDLLTQNYEFTAAKGENTNRFTLYVRVERKKAPNQETDVDNILDGKLSLITIGKTLVLSGLTAAADVYVYDMSGKLLSRDQAGNGIWRTTVPATGVYFVRVDSANGQQTLRSIVK